MSFKSNQLDWFACLLPLWGPVTWKGLQICASLNHRKNIKADPSADSSKALTVNRGVSIVDVRRVIFLELMPDVGCLMRIARFWK